MLFFVFAKTYMNIKIKCVTIFFPFLSLFSWGLVPLPPGKILPHPRKISARFAPVYHIIFGTKIIASNSCKNVTNWGTWYLYDIYSNKCQKVVWTMHALLTYFMKYGIILFLLVQHQRVTETANNWYQELFCTIWRNIKHSL